MAKNGEYISLKEAARLSGYSADYVGQLIRGGKLPGKQVFSNVSWVTTEKAILEYLRQERGEKKTSGAKTQGRLRDPQFLMRMYTIAVWAAAVVFVLFAFLIVHIVSLGIDHAINQKYLKDVLQREAAR